MKRLLPLLTLLLLTTGCATRPNGADYQALQPAFDLFRFFDGDVVAYGLVQNRSGDVVQKFTVDIHGTVTGDLLTLDEEFSYTLGDGLRERVWTIERDSNGIYRGQAGDVLGSANGRTYGSAFQWEYRMDLPVGDGAVRVRFNDWIWALDDQHIINRSYIQKFGFDVAEVTLFMQRRQLPATPDVDSP
jgi:hypothetical protein